MKKLRAKLGMGLLFSALVLTTGCGNKAIQLTDEEEGLIVDYAAHVVSKFNTRQPDGLVYVDTSQEEEESETTEEPQQEENSQNIPADSTAGQLNGLDTEEAQPEQTTLTQALGIEGVDAVVSATELMPSYKEGDYYALDAEAGKTFLVVHVTLNNNTAADISCDLLSGNPQFQAEVNGAGAVPAEMTVLLNDFSTYQGTLPAGSSTDTVLLFQVPADVTQVDSLTLDLAWKGNTYRISGM